LYAPPSYLDFPDGRHIAYRYQPPRQAGRPTLLFLPGYASDMEGTKALAIEAYAAETGCGCLRLDYSGTGASSGAFADGTLERWLEEVLAAVDRITKGRLIVVGSSMGGWLMLHLALRVPDRVHALVGIAAAPDFTSWGFSEAEKSAISAEGKLEQPNPYGPEPSVIHGGFWQSGESLNLLDAPIPIECPVRLLHGDQDEEVPVGIALRLLEQLRSRDVQLLLIKGGGHRLSQPHEIDALLGLLGPLVETAA
jgi:pimeloyl-ACP methyl ester carboxylesterase